MKRLLFFGLLLLACTGAMLSQGVPQSMSYQGYVTDLTGTPVADGNYNFTFTLYTSEVAGAAVWTETHTNVQVAKGLFTVQLGRGNPPMPFTITFDQQYYLGIQIGADPELSPRVRLATSAYSFRAKMAENVIPALITDAHVAPLANIAASKLHTTVLTESEIVAGSGVTVNNAGGTLTISASGGAVTLGGDVTGPAGSNTIANDAVTAAKISPNIVSSLDGVSNDGGDIDLVAGANITLTPNDAANTITIAASGGGGGLTLPYTGNASSSSAAFDVEQTGSGRAGWFHVTNAASTADVLNAYTTSTSTSSTALRAQATGGRAIEAFNNSASMATIYAYNTNAGPVAQFGNTSSSTGNIVEITKSGGSGKGLNVAYTGTSNAVYIDNNSTGTGLELRQDGAGKAAYFHVENTTSTENALLVESKSTSSSSDAIQATAVGGRAFYGTSAGANSSSIYVTNTGGGRAIYGGANTSTFPALSATNSNTTANAVVISGSSSLGEIFKVDREGDIDADGSVSADAYVVRNSQTGAPTVGTLYKNNLVHAWARVTVNGGIVESFGVSGITNPAAGTYVVTLNNAFPNGNSMCATVTAFWPSGPRFAMVSAYNTGTVTVETYTSAGTLSNTSFSIVIVGQY